jgi:hypothetical protein
LDSRDALLEDRADEFYNKEIVLKNKHIKKLLKAKFAFRSTYARDIMQQLKDRFVGSKTEL